MLTILLIILIASRAKRIETVVMSSIIIQAITAAITQNPLHLLVSPIYLLIGVIAFMYCRKKTNLLGGEKVIAGIKRPMPLGYSIISFIGRAFLIVIIILMGLFIFSMLNDHIT